MTDFQIKERLKHIGGLCYGLALDFAKNLENENALRAECEALRNELEAIKASPAYIKAKSIEANRRRVARRRERLLEANRHTGDRSD